MLWVTRRWHTDAFVDGDEGVNGAEGNPFQKIRVCQSMQMSFFSTSGPHTVILLTTMSSRLAVGDGVDKRRDPLAVGLRVDGAGRRANS